MARHIDFDALWADVPEPPGPTCTIHGAEVTLPSSCPILVILLAARIADSGQRESVTLDEVVKALHMVFGSEIVDQWIAGGIDRAKFATLVCSIPGLYRASDDEPGNAKKAKKTKKKADADV